MYNFPSHSITKRRGASCPHHLTSHNQGLKEFRQTGFITYQIKLQEDKNGPMFSYFTRKLPFLNKGLDYFFFSKNEKTYKFLFEKTFFFYSNFNDVNELLQIDADVKYISFISCLSVSYSTCSCNCGSKYTLLSHSCHKRNR